MPGSIESTFRLKKPCANCPFLKEGAIHLSPGRLDGIIDNLMVNDHSNFMCHKTVHSRNGGEFDENGDYHASGREAMCAGATAYLMKKGRFMCHKTVHSRNGGEFDENGDYHASGREAMCAGATAYLMKKGRPTIGMRIAFMTKSLPVSHWDEAKDQVID